tara:strand:- start:684 stop:788 length:105 start_codon:yes stop_codon:yes gene_type:complete
MKENKFFSDVNIYSYAMVLSGLSIFEEKSRKGFK